MESLAIPLGELQEIFKRMTEEEGEVKVSPPTNTTDEIKKLKKTIISKMFCQGKKETETCRTRSNWKMSGSHMGRHQLFNKRKDIWHNRGQIHKTETAHENSIS